MPRIRPPEFPELEKQILQQADRTGRIYTA